jgi:hypothetical protein
MRANKQVQALAIKAMMGAAGWKKCCTTHRAILGSDWKTSPEGP